MKANELRPGSHVAYKQFVVTLAAEDFAQLEDDIDKGIITPVKITEERLIIIGFEKLKVSGYVILGATYWKKGNIVIYKSGDKYYVPIGERVGNISGRTAIVFDKIHELQNIFILAGDELTLNQKP